jgi:signal transduction histidine kinase
LVAALLIQVAHFRFQRWKADTLIGERERLAHEIHDTMAQGFAGVGYQIQGIRKMVSASERMDRQYISDQLGVAYQLVRSCHDEASRTIAMLNPASPPIEDNLLTTLSEAARRISGEQIATIARTEGAQNPLPLRTVNALLHIGREAVVNAAAHSTPSEIRITLRYTAESVELIVADNGAGFEFTQARAGFGILGMQKRARDVGGELRIQSTPAVGTEVRIRVRVREETAIQHSFRVLGKRLWKRA